MTAPVVGGFTGDTVLEVSVAAARDDGRPTAVTLAHLQELVERCAFLGIPHNTVVIFAASGLEGTRRVRVTQAGVRVALPSGTVSGVAEVMARA